MDTWARLAREIDEQHHQQDLEENDRCMINQDLVCTDCGCCNIDEEY